MQQWCVCVHLHLTQFAFAREGAGRGTRGEGVKLTSIAEGVCSDGTLTQHIHIAGGVGGGLAQSLQHPQQLGLSQPGGAPPVRQPHLHHRLPHRRHLHPTRGPLPFLHALLRTPLLLAIPFFPSQSRQSHPMAGLAASHPMTVCCEAITIAIICTLCMLFK